MKSSANALRFSTGSRWIANQRAANLTANDDRNFQSAKAMAKTTSKGRMNRGESGERTRYVA